MGELVRCLLARLTKDGLLFDGKGTDKLFLPHIIDTSFVSEVEGDPIGQYGKTRKALERMDILDATDEDCEHVRMVCSRISTRAAYLVSAAIATIINRMKRPQVTVGVDGLSLIHI